MEGFLLLTSTLALIVGLDGLVQSVRRWLRLTQARPPYGQPRSPQGATTMVDTRINERSDTGGERP